MSEIIIDDSSPDQMLFPAEHPGFGLVPREFGDYPVDYLSPPTEIQLIPRSEWSDRIKEMERDKSRLSDLRGDFKSYNQQSDGYCWAYSTTAATTLQRMVSGQRTVRLSAHSVATVIKNGRNEGGWCGLSAKYIVENGVASESVWPAARRDLSLNTERAKQSAKRYRITEGFYDFSRPLYDQRLTFDQVATCLLNRIPCAGDFNWWGHSVCLMDLVEVEPGSFGLRIWNSWGDSWSDRGMGILRGDRAIPNGAIAVRSATLSGELDVG
jgi:C1A family cysteine protease